MITLVEALNYRCLRYIRQPLGPFHVLVGPNASGKTTFLDVIAFLGRLVSDGPDAAIEERTQNFYDLVWGREGTRFELAIEARIPDALPYRLKEFDTIRYEVGLEIIPQTQVRGIVYEDLILKQTEATATVSRAKLPLSLMENLDELDHQVVIAKDSQEDGYSPETEDKTYRRAAWRPMELRMGPRRSALQFLPPSIEAYPASSWFKEALTSSVQQFVLNSLLIRKASPPGQGLGFRTDGSNLPWVVAELRKRSPDPFRQWIAHLRTAFPDLEDIDTIERPEDRHRYLVFQYNDGLKVPSWMASDGTLRMLALTLPAYLGDFRGIYLIEEPENGIHPRAIETMTQSLSSVYDAQVLLATHSPVILSTVGAEQVLCFAKDAEGATMITKGSEHPALKSWKHETTLGTLFAAGVLG